MSFASAGGAIFVTTPSRIRTQNALTRLLVNVAPGMAPTDPRGLNQQTPELVARPLRGADQRGALPSPETGHRRRRVDAGGRAIGSRQHAICAGARLRIAEIGVTRRAIVILQVSREEGIRVPNVLV